MPKAKAYVCGYTFCKHSGEKVSSDIAVKDGTRYYHPDCHPRENIPLNGTFSLIH